MKERNLTDDSIWQCANRCGFIGVGHSFDGICCPACGKIGRDLVALVDKPGVMAVWDERCEVEPRNEKPV